MEINKSKGVIEAILFAAGREVKITELMSALEASSEEVITLVESMKEDYKNENRGYTLWDQMINIYKKYGFYKELTISITREGVTGAEEIKQMMEKMRENQATTLEKYKVVEFRDYKKDIIKNNATGETTKTGLPNSNVLYYGLENDAWCCVRPSGTEPKIKFYMGVKGKTEEEAEQELKELTKVMEEQAKM